MEDIALPIADVKGGDGDIDNDDDVDYDNNNIRDNDRKRLRKRMEMFERRRLVGYTINLIVNLWNSSHFDVNYASQGYSVWTVETLGLGQNWYFVIPNVHGLRPDGTTKFHDMAVKPVTVPECPLPSM